MTERKDCDCEACPRQSVGGCGTPGCRTMTHRVNDDLCPECRKTQWGRDRLRKTAQILIEEIGADGPMDAEEAAEKAVTLIKELRERVAWLSREREASIRDEIDRGADDD